MMQNILKRSLWIPILIITTQANALVIPYLSFRSQGINGAREIVGWQTQINKFDVEYFYGSFSVTPEYTHSFQNYLIATYLWCDALAPEEDFTTGKAHLCNDPFIRIQGTKVRSRIPNALMAENFYLPTDFESEVRFHPVIENALVDFNLYLGLDNLAPGLYFRIHTPLCHTRWALNMHEKVINPGTFNYDPGYFNDTFTGSGAEPFQDPNAYGIKRSRMLANFSEYIQDGQAIDGVEGMQYDGLKYARIPHNALHKTGLAEITAAFGWNFWQSEDFHFGINARAAAPTGNRPCGKYLFEPIVGNGHHWELGAGITAHVCLMHTESEMSDLSFYLDSYFTHLFSTRQCRTFDLCGSPLSRYMLAMQFTDSATDLRAGSIDMTLAQDKHFVPLANLTTIPVDVSALFQGEFLFKLAYTYKNFQFDIGYDLWARSCENIKPCNTHALSSHLWALKGDAFTFGFSGFSTMPGNFTIEQPGIPLSATESEATIFNGTNNYPSGLEIESVPLDWNQNPGVDSVALAYDVQGNHLYTHLIGKTGPSATDNWDFVGTSSMPQFISANSLGFDRASTKSYSQKLFMHFNYIFHCHQWTPYIGLGLEIEFGDEGEEFGCNQCRKSCCNSDACASGQCPGGTCCTIKPISCAQETDATASLSQFGIWIKGGFSF
jgi:hypothetical protein